MTREEIEKAIKNGESVWVALDDKVERLVNLEWFTDDVVKSYNMDIGVSHMIMRDYFNHLYKTKVEAEHYLHHANVTRTETLPFLTWEEFNEGVELSTTTKNGEKLKLYIGLPDDGIYYMYMRLGNKQQNVGEATEVNFYKIYDECVRLFKQE